MNAPHPLMAPSSGDALAFADIAHEPARHFRLALHGVIAQLISQCTGGDLHAAFEAQPFLADYHDELTARVGVERPAPAAWAAALARWEAASPRPLPLLSLQQAGIDRLALELLLAAGLGEEDPRFGDAFETAQGERRPTFALLQSWWRVDAGGEERAEAVRAALLRLIRTGLLHVHNPDAVRLEWQLSVPHAIWDALRGDPPDVAWLDYVPHAQLPSLCDYIAPPALGARIEALPALLDARRPSTLIVRGPGGNGRGTLLGGIAQRLGRSLLAARASVLDSATQWVQFGIIAELLEAMPVLRCELALGETRVLPALAHASAPLGVATGRQGSWSAVDARTVLTLELPLPGGHERHRHWRAAAPTQSDASLAALATGSRLGSGHIRRVATAAAGYASLATRSAIAPEDVQLATRALQAARLETLAARLPSQGGLAELAVDATTRDELDALLARCRHREALAVAGPRLAHGNAGVRALFAGGSGTGKTLAARLLAGELGKDLYRVDLAATVNKFLGETEKNLDRALAAAEELDVVLLLDEGDALMANRTEVGSSNDRYANLETNFLLQRIETFEGILIVTSNAADRIDKAFTRRMDVVIPFRPPDEWRRYDILKLHLGDADIDDAWLQDMACRCALSGGQLRNIVGHARLLALQDSGALRTAHMHASLSREYRKTGAACPLRLPDVERPAGAR